MADVVVHEVRGRSPAAAEAGRMESRHDLQLDAFGPYRIVFVFAVEAEEIQPEGEAAGLLAELALHIWNRALRIIRHEQRLET